MKKTTVEDRIVTLHPRGKRGVHIAREEYEVVHKAILRALEDGSEKTHAELFADVVL